VNDVSFGNGVGVMLAAPWLLSFLREFIVYLVIYPLKVYNQPFPKSTHTSSPAVYHKKESREYAPKSLMIEIMHSEEGMTSYTKDDERMGIQRNQSLSLCWKLN
jgi:hypothetical protein